MAGPMEGGGGQQRDAPTTGTHSLEAPGPLQPQHPLLSRRGGHSSGNKEATKDERKEKV